MRRSLAALVFVLALSLYGAASSSIAATRFRATSTQVDQFFSALAPLAQAEQAQYGIPASMVLAVAADETGYGQNTFSQQNNDYFNVTCGANGAGYTEGPRASGVVYNGSYCYLTYNSAADNFLDWGYFLAHDAHYANLPHYLGSAPDIDGAIAALYADGYAGTENIAVVQAIRNQYNLAQYDGTPVPSGSCTLASCVIQETDPAFSWQGNVAPPARNDQAIGYNGHSFWSANCGPGTASDCGGGGGSDVTGTWSPTLPQAGRYEVDIAVPAVHATTSNAVYTVQGGTGGPVTATVDQNAYPPAGAAVPYAWATLGAYLFNAGAGASVSLTDQTGEPYGSHDVAWSAVRFVYQGSGTQGVVTPEPAVGTATPIGSVPQTATATFTATPTPRPSSTPLPLRRSVATLKPLVHLRSPLTLALRIPHNLVCTTAPLTVRVHDHALAHGTLTLIVTRLIPRDLVAHGRHRRVQAIVVVYRRLVHVMTDRRGIVVVTRALPCLLPRPQRMLLTMDVQVAHDREHIRLPLLLYKRTAPQKKRTVSERAVRAPRSPRR